MNVTNDIPSSQFDGYVKFVAVDKLTRTVLAHVKTLFPRFFEDATPEPSRSELRELSSRMSGVEMRGQRRRFSGDELGLSILPRRRYFSICSDSEGLDYETLGQELTAYADLRAHGLYVVADLGYSNVAADFGLAAPRRELTVMRPAGGGKRSATVPVLDFDETIAIPYSVTEMHVANVLDLRLPSTRHWFANYFKRGDGEIFTVSEAINEPWSFFSMWPTVVSPELGGNSLTDAIGAWMRKHGVSGFIYPSARTDHFVHVKDGVVYDFGGWNFVDYRGAAASYDVPFSKMSATLHWGSPWPREIHSPINIEISAPGSEWDGSFEVHGLEARQLRMRTAHLRNSNESPPPSSA